MGDPPSERGHVGSDLHPQGGHHGHAAAARLRLRGPRARGAARLAPGRHRAHGVSRGALGDGAGGGGLLHRRRPPPAAARRRRGAARRRRCLPSPGGRPRRHARGVQPAAHPVGRAGRADCGFRAAMARDRRLDLERSQERGRHGGRALPRRDRQRDPLAAGAARRRRPSHRPAVPLARLRGGGAQGGALRRVPRGTRSRALHLRRPHHRAVDRRRPPRPRAPIGLVTASSPAPARRTTSARGGASSALSSGAAGCCAVDGAPSPPTIGATSTRGGTSTTGASCRSSATRSSIPQWGG